MLECFNAGWALFIAFILFIIVVSKLYNICQTDKEKNINYQLTSNMIPTMASYYVGLQ
jgi:hypothetical protein